MNIAFDASDMCTGRADGTTRYTQELAKRMPGIAKDVSWDFYGPCVAPSHPLQLPLGQGERTTWHASPFPFAWTQTRFAWELFKKKPDVLFMPIQQLPIFRPHKTKTVAVIHDLAFHAYKEQFRYKDWLLLHTFSAQVANEADAIIAVSQATKDDIKKYYGRTHNVHVVHHGIDHDKFRVFSDEEKQSGLKKLQEKYPDISAKYLLFVGQIQPRKNIVRLVETFEALSSHPLQLPLRKGENSSPPPMNRSPTRR
ncbi:MAG: glycosyltransferase, partial [bacterium]|nr:glycosyltransferase [bacterium]